MALGGLISDKGSRHALKALSDTKVTRYHTTPPVPGIRELQDNPTAYDAACVALAEALDVSPVTTDGRLTRAPGHRARVESYS